MTEKCDKSLTVSIGCPDCNSGASLWIRTAAGPDIGFGHLRRTCVLADALQGYCHSTFLLDPEDHWSRELVKEKGWRFFDFDSTELWSSSHEPDALVIDTRKTAGVDRLIKTAKEHKLPVISIHDLGLELFPSDIIIDGSIAPRPCRDISPCSTYFSGLDYMILDPVYSSLGKEQKQFRKKIQSVYINLGGGDSRKFFFRILEGVKLWSQEAEVVGVPGFVSWGQEGVLENTSTPVNFRWENRNIDRFLFQASLAITAGGLSAYESLCMGTPLLCMAYDSFQQTTISKLAAGDACIDLGLGDELDPIKLAEILSQLDADIDRRKQLSINGRSMVDGRGAERVAHIIRQAMTNRIERRPHPYSLQSNNSGDGCCRDFNSCP
jgi:spore coat polysaccharide biosynthesis predicted glycosyltransferase SpsG